MNRRLLISLGTVALAASTCVSVSAQAPDAVPIPPPTTTLWNFLGIPQALDKISAQTFNRRGNRPALEKKPPLKKIADPANLKSEVPAIKAAAEIKQAEDLKPQKIKAIKYLATIGCGCYDKDEKVTKALLAAMEDCTEEVRLEAVRAISVAASSERCSNCKQRSCCNEKIAAQLYKIAYELDDLGCHVEASARVREAAVEALGICCPSQLPVTEAETEPVPEEGTSPPAPAEGTSPAEPAPANPQPPTTAAQSPTPVDHKNFLRDAAFQSNVPEGMVSSRRTARLRTAAAQATETAQPALQPYGDVRLVDTQRNLMHVHLTPGLTEMPVGARLRLLSPSDNGMVVAGEVQVVQSMQGSATVRPVGELRVADVRRGSVIVR